MAPSARYFILGLDSYSLVVFARRIRSSYAFVGFRRGAAPRVRVRSVSPRPVPPPATRATLPLSRSIPALNNTTRFFTRQKPRPNEQRRQVAMQLVVRGGRRCRSRRYHYIPPWR